ncbi:MAG: phosphoribosylformylglycinamidine cyclo-ligase [Thermoplasmata archaeon]|nr:MAG: phosphoribosylformylglycinamidine cyclo-ligase [Thermoplasmata archaeon]
MQDESKKDSKLKDRSEKGLTYADAGVDIDAESTVISELVKQFKKYPVEGLGKPIELPGHFTGLVEFGDYALTLCTDGVGTKIMIANELKKWDTVGIDCIAMNVNDTICIGAKPVAFVDYLAMEEPSKDIVAEIGKGLAKGAELAGINIIGGETATLKGIINGVDLAGTCLGFIERDKIITGKKIVEGDAIVGLPSSGIHSNGLTLARKIIELKQMGYNAPFPGSPDNASIGEVLLTPTKIYVKDILGVLPDLELHGLANITGGGLKNIMRLKEDVHFKITDPLPVPEIFKSLKDWGKVSTHEMYQTFNMGLGFCIVLPQADANKLVNRLKDSPGAKIIGYVEKGKGLSVPDLDLKF